MERQKINDKEWFFKIKFEKFNSFMIYLLNYLFFVKYFFILYYFFNFPDMIYNKIIFIK